MTIIIIQTVLALAMFGVGALWLVSWNVFCDFMKQGDTQSMATTFGVLIIITGILAGLGLLIQTIPNLL